MRSFDRAVRDFVEGLKVREIVAQSQATEEITELAEELENWWKENKDRFLNGLSN